MATVGTFYQNLRSARTTLRDIARMREIALVLVRHGFGHVVQTWRFRDQAVVAPVVVSSATSERLSGPGTTNDCATRVGTNIREVGTDSVYPLRSDPPRVV